MQEQKKSLIGKKEKECIIVKLIPNFILNTIPWSICSCFRGNYLHNYTSWRRMQDWLYFQWWSPCAAIHPKAHGCNWTLKNYYLHLGHSSLFGDLRSATSENWSSGSMILKVNWLLIGEGKIVMVLCSPCLYFLAVVVFCTWL